VILKLTWRWVKNNKGTRKTTCIFPLPTPINHRAGRNFELTSFFPGARWLFTNTRYSNLTLQGFYFKWPSGTAYSRASRRLSCGSNACRRGEPLLELRKDPSKLDLPVLRTVTRHGGLSDKMLDESTFRYYFQQMTRNAACSPFVLCGALANVVDSKFPSSASPTDVRRCCLPPSRNCHS